jgi:hypothetical protein
MKLTNRTVYNGKDLRAFITWVSNQEMWTPEMRSRLRVKAVSARQWHTGEAWASSYYIKIRIPAPARLCKMKLASLVAHELTHLTNEKHVPYSTERWMRSSGRYGFRDYEKHWAGAKDLPLRVNEPKAVSSKVTPSSRAEDGLRQAEKKVTGWKSKMRRAETMLKKWQGKVRYYTKRVQSLEAQPSETGSEIISESGLSAAMKETEGELR